MSQEKRRQVLLAAGALLAVPCIGFAQQASRMWRVGYINPGGRRDYLEEFRKGMRELGYEEGRNLVIEWRFADGHFERLPALAADLVSMRVDVILAGGTPVVAALKNATSTIPIVMTTVGDPVASGFVTSLARPGGNITGLTLANPEMSLKWFELARIVSPGSRIGILTNPTQPTGRWYVQDIQTAAQKLGIEVPVAHAATIEEIERAFSSLAQERVTTVIVLPNGLFDANADRIAQFAVKHRMASIATTKHYAEGGALLSYGQDYAAFARRAATYVDKILRGAKPSELPIEQPMIMETVINLKTAHQLGLSMPKELLLRANTTID